MTGYDIIEDKIIEYYESNKGIQGDVFCIFEMKYSYETEWTKYMEPALYSGDCYEFVNDFCEGQQEIRNILIVPFEEVVNYWLENHKENQDKE